MDTQWPRRRYRNLLVLALTVAGHVVGLIALQALSEPPILLQRRSSASAADGRIAVVLLEDVDAKTPPIGEPSAQPVPAGAVASGYVPASTLDGPLVPMSAPDTGLLQGLYFSGLPIRVRLFISASGRVVDVLPLQASPDDAEAVRQIKAMFMATAYIPGLLNGTPVAAQLDMELQLGAVESFPR